MIRKLMKSDDLEKAAELIYETDDFLFPFLFGKKREAIPLLIKLIESDNNTFSHKNIYCHVENEIQGILIGYDTENKTNEHMDYQKSFSFFGSIEFVIKKALLRPLLDITDVNGLYIQNISVDDNYRGKGIGSALIDHYCDLGRRSIQKNVFLDVSLKNKGAFRLYEKKGFEVMSKKKIGFSGVGIYRMRKILY